MARNREIVDGIKLWLNARQAEAIHTNDKATFQALEILHVDLARSIRTNEYPWEVIVRGYNERAAKEENKE